MRALAPLTAVDTVVGEERGERFHPNLTRLLCSKTDTQAELNWTALVFLSDDIDQCHGFTTTCY